LLERLLDVSPEEALQNSNDIVKQLSIGKNEEEGKEITEEVVVAKVAEANRMVTNQL
jgi:hypothetical protein